jgi:hypothetical protein
MTSSCSHLRRLKREHALVAFLYIILASAVWWYMPVQPRATLPGNSQILALSPDGNLLAILQGASVTFWDVATGRPIGALPGYLANFKRFTFSTDGRWLEASGTGLWKLWEVPSCREVVSIPGWDREGLHPNTTFSPDSKWLLVQGYGPDKSRYAKIWDLLNEREWVMLPPYLANPVFSPDGKTLALENSESASEASPNYRIQLWDMETGKRAISFKGDFPSARRLSFSADGRSLIACALHNRHGAHEVSLWDVASGQLRGSWKLLQPISAVWFSADDSKLLVESYHSLIQTGLPRPHARKLTVFDPTAQLPEQEYSLPAASSLSPNRSVLVSFPEFSELARLNDAAQRAVIFDVHEMCERARLTPLPLNHRLKARGFVPPGLFFAVEGTPIDRPDPPPPSGVLEWIYVLVRFNRAGHITPTASDLHLYETGTGQWRAAVSMVPNTGVWFGPNGRTLIVTAPDGQSALWTGVPTIWELPLKKPWGRILALWATLGACFAGAWLLHNRRNKPRSALRGVEAHHQSDK